MEGNFLINRLGPAEWPPRSPDFPLFSFWGFLKAQMYADKIRDLRLVRQRIRDCCTAVRPNMLGKIRTNLVKRLRQCVQRREHVNLSP
jgi:hypothetical protein